MTSTPILAIVIFIVIFALTQQAWASKAAPKGTKRLPGPDGDSHPSRAPTTSHF